MGWGLSLSVRMMACGLNAARQAASSNSRRYWRVSSTACLITSTGTSSAAGSLSISPALFLKSPAQSCSSRRKSLGDVLIPAATYQFWLSQAEFIAATAHKRLDCQCLLLGFGHKKSSGQLPEEDMSSPLGCHVCGRIPLSRRPPCQGRQVGECASALVLMMFGRIASSRLGCKWTNLKAELGLRKRGRGF